MSQSTLLLPPKLITLIQSGKWKHGLYRIRNLNLKELAWTGETVELYSSKEIEASEESFLEITENGGSQYYGLYNSSLPDSEDSEIWLDINKAYIIADNISEEMICLDYRYTPNIPRVLASDYSQGEGRWREIAKTFEEFWNMLEPAS